MPAIAPLLLAPKGHVGAVQATPEENFAGFVFALLLWLVVFLALWAFHRHLARRDRKPRRDDPNLHNPAERAFDSVLRAIGAKPQDKGR